MGFHPLLKCEIKLLERSLGGNPKTLLLLQVAQEKRHVQETLQTLAFGQRARGVETAASATGSKKGCASKYPSISDSRGRVKVPIKGVTEKTFRTRLDRNT